MKARFVDNPMWTDVRQDLLDAAADVLAREGVQVAIDFYVELRRRHPRFAAMFSTTEIHHQAVRIASMLRTIVASARGDNDLGSIAINLGISHASRGIKPCDYTDFCETLSDILADRQIEVPREVAKDLWITELSAIAEVMMAVGPF